MEIITMVKKKNSPLLKFGLIAALTVIAIVISLGLLFYIVTILPDNTSVTASVVEINDAPNTSLNSSYGFTTSENLIIGTCKENKIDWTKLKIVLEILNKTTLGKEKEFPITIYSINNNLTTKISYWKNEIIFRSLDNGVFHSGDFVRLHAYTGKDLACASPNSITLQ